jgi:L-ascorbate metabolism protein UlaG (beta-lactamase superfamily)
VIEPALRNDAFLADVAAARAASGVHLWWLGQSGFLILAHGRALVLDPYLSDSLTRKYDGTDQPHVRMTERVVAPEHLAPVDVVTSSHNHADHLDAETLEPLLEANPGAAFVVAEANRSFVAERLRVPPERLTAVDDGATIERAGFAITAVPAAHEELERDEHGRLRHVGYVVRAGDRTLYHSGDTVLFDGMEERLRPFGLDVAVLPINGRDPGRGVVGNLDGPEAARLAHAVGAGLAVPCHYEMFEFNTASPEAFARECERLGQPYRVVRAGERLTLG